MSSGGIYRWTAKTDDRDVPDCLSAIYDYSDKLQVNYSCYLGNEYFGYGEELCGNEGTLRIMNRQDLYFEPETYNARRPGAADRAPPTSRHASRFTSTAGPISTKAMGPSTTSATSSRPIQGNEKVIAPPPVGQQAAITGHMATLSYKNQKKIVWDDSANKYHFI